MVDDCNKSIFIGCCMRGLGKPNIGTRRTPSTQAKQHGPIKVEKSQSEFSGCLESYLSP